MHSSLILVGKRIKKINKLLTMLDNGNVKERNSTKKKKGRKKGQRACWCSFRIQEALVWEERRKQKCITKIIMLHFSIWTKTKTKTQRLCDL